MKKKKIFDIVQMVRNICAAFNKKQTAHDFDPKEFERVRKKWSKLLKLEKK